VALVSALLALAVTVAAALGRPARGTGLAATRTER